MRELLRYAGAEIITPKVKRECHERERGKRARQERRGAREKLEWRLTSNRLDNNPQMDVVEDFSISLLKQKTQLVVTPMK